MYSEVMDDPKVQRLSGNLFKFWVNLLCMACKNNGTIHVSDFSFGLRISDKKGEKVLNALLSAGLVEITEKKIVPHNWSGRQFISDTSNERVRRFREKHGNVSCNVTVTTDVTQEDDTNKRYSNGPETLQVTPPDTDTDTDTEKKKTKDSATPKKARACAFILPSHFPKESWEEWMTLRKKKRATNSDYAMKLLADKVQQISELLGLSVQEIIDMAIIRNWIGIEESWVQASIPSSVNSSKTNQW